MSTTPNEIEEVDCDYFGFKHAGDHTLKDFAPFQTGDPNGSYALLSTEKTKGIFAAADDRRLFLGDTATWETRSIEVPHITHLSLTHDGESVVVALQGGIAMFDMTLKQQRQIPTPAISHFQPNPASATIAVIAEGKAFVIDVSTGNALEITGEATAISWSRKGKQLVVASHNGWLRTFLPTGEAKSTFTTLNTQPVESVHWIDNVTFFVALGSSTVQCYIFTQPDSWLHVVDPAPPFGDRKRTGSHHVLQVSSWSPNIKDMLVITYSKSSDVGIVTRSMDDGKWKLLCLDDARRASVPDYENKEASPIGLAVDLSSTTTLLIGDKEVSPLPRVWFLDQAGRMRGYYLEYDDAIRNNESFPELLSLNSHLNELSVESPSNFLDQTTENSEVAANLSSDSKISPTRPLSESSTRPHASSTPKSMSVPAPALQSLTGQASLHPPQQSLETSTGSEVPESSNVVSQTEPAFSGLSRNQTSFGKPTSFSSPSNSLSFGTDLQKVASPQFTFGSAESAQQSALFSESVVEETKSSSSSVFDQTASMQSSDADTEDAELSNDDELDDDELSERSVDRIESSMNPESSSTTPVGQRLEKSQYVKDDQDDVLSDSLGKAVKLEDQDAPLTNQYESGAIPESKQNVSLPLAKISSPTQKPSRPTESQPSFVPPRPVFKLPEPSKASLFPFVAPTSPPKSPLLEVAGDADRKGSSNTEQPIGEVMEESESGRFEMPDFQSFSSLSPQKITGSGIEGAFAALDEQITSEFQVLHKNLKIIEKFVRSEKHSQLPDDFDFSNSDAWRLSDAILFKELSQAWLDDAVDFKQRNMANEKAVSDQKRFLVRLESRQVEISRLLRAKSDPHYMNTIRVKTLPPDLAFLQQKLRRGNQECEALLRKLEIDIGKVKVAVSGRSMPAPDVESVTRTMARISSHCQQRVTQMDYLERQVRRLRATSPERSFASSIVSPGKKHQGNMLSENVDIEDFVQLSLEKEERLQCFKKRVLKSGVRRTVY